MCFWQINIQYYPFSCRLFKPLSVPISPALVSEDQGRGKTPLFMTSIKLTWLLSLSHDLRVATYRRLCKCESPQCGSLFSSTFLQLFFKLLSLSLPTHIYVLFSGVYDYELTLRTDMYTRKHTQWFYFRVRNMKAEVTYRFTIVNLMKSSSLYSQGMRPLIYSERAAKEREVGWQRTGSDIRYYRNCNQVGGNWSIQNS